MPRASQRKRKGDVQSAAGDVSSDLFHFLNNPASTKRVKTKDTMTANRFQCLVDQPADPSIHGQGPLSDTNAVSDLEMEKQNMILPTISLHS